jgi:hypothetical protein
MVFKVKHQISKGVDWLKGKFDLKEEEAKRYHSSSSTRKRQNAPWKHLNASKLT